MQFASIYDVDSKKTDIIDLQIPSVNIPHFRQHLDMSLKHHDNVSQEILYNLLINEFGNIDAKFVLSNKYDLYCVRVHAKGHHQIVAILPKCKGIDVVCVKAQRFWCWNQQKLHMDLFTALCSAFVYAVFLYVYFKKRFFACTISAMTLFFVIFATFLGHSVFCLYKQMKTPCFVNTIQKLVTNHFFKKN